MYTIDPRAGRHLGALILLLVVATATIAADKGYDKKVNGYAKYVVRHYGDAERGRRLAEQDNVACLKCHAVTGKEKNAPNLTGISNKFSREDLVRHILMPSLTIRPGYETTDFVLSDGQVVSGNVREANDDSYRVWTAAGEYVTIRASDVEQQTVSTKSLMPDNLMDHLSREKLSDLVAYLESLRTERRRGLIGRNSEVNIPVLRRPIQLAPINDDSSRFERPVWFEAIPGHANEYVVLEHQNGIVYRLTTNPRGVEKNVFLDLSDEVSRGPNEGLMCVAFHPDYLHNGRYFIKHESRADGELHTQVVERQAADNRVQDAGESSRVLFAVKQPSGNHNGGCIRFGPDGFLYIAFGDGGPQRDPHGRSQSLHEFLGSMMRIDVNEKSAKKPYGIPAGNPFVDLAKENVNVLPEIWATGFREPWRFSFDSLTGDLWLGDVGQVKFEEISIVRRGDNCGWNVMEGFEPFSDEYKINDAVYSPPVFAYSHSLGASVTGGEVYRGDASSSFYGVYIFGDFESRRIWGIQRVGEGFGKIRELGRSPIAMSGFGTMRDGALALVGFDGLIYRLDLTQTEFE